MEDGIEKTSSVLNSVIYCKVISRRCDFYARSNFYNHGTIKRRKLGISSQEEIRLEIEVNLWRKKIKVSIFEKLYVLPRISKGKNTTFKQVSPRHFQEAKKKKTFFFSFVIMTEAKEALNFFSDGGSHLNVQRSLFSRSCYSLHKYWIYHDILENTVKI